MANAPYFIILLCLMPDDFTLQRESACTHCSLDYQTYLAFKEYFYTNIYFNPPFKTHDYCSCSLWGMEAIVMSPQQTSSRILLTAVHYWVVLLSKVLGS
jgi:hypothetical protein